MTPIRTLLALPALLALTVAAPAQQAPAPADAPPVEAAPATPPAETAPAETAPADAEPTEAIAPSEAPTTTDTAPAGAEAAGFDPAAMNSCLEAAADPAAKYACVGQAAQACTEASGNDSTIGMSACYGAELDLWKAQLNATYDKLNATHEASDKRIEGVGATPQAPELEAAEKAWLAYRDAECSYQAGFFAGGSGAGPAQVLCEMTLTGQRAIDLNASLLAAETR